MTSQLTYPLTKKLGIFAKVVIAGEAQTVFVKDVDIDSGKSEHVFDTLKSTVSNEYKVPLSSVFAFGSDGASSMVGKNNSVTSRLKKANPFLINCHCAGHRCALCVSQAADSVPEVQAYRDTLCAVYSFYASSSIRQKKMKDFQELFEGSKIPVKLKQLHRVRWLSMAECVEAMYRAWDGVCLSLDEEPAKVAKNLHDQVATVGYLLMTAVMCDILAVISQLSKTFQARDIDLSMIESAVNLAISKLQTMKEEPGDKYAFVLGALENCGSETTHRNVFMKDNTPAARQDVSKQASDFIDSICVNLRQRFPEDETCVLGALDKILKSTQNTCTCF